MKKYLSFNFLCFSMIRRSANNRMHGSFYHWSLCYLSYLTSCFGHQIWVCTEEFMNICNVFKCGKNAAISTKDSKFICVIHFIRCPSYGHKHDSSVKLSSVCCRTEGCIYFELYIVQTLNWYDFNFKSVCAFGFNGDGFKKIFSKR